MHTSFPYTEIGCSMGHTVPVTGAVYRGMGLSCGFCLDTTDMPRTQQRSMEPEI